MHLTRRLGRAGPTAAADGLLVNGTPLPAGVLDPGADLPKPVDLVLGVLLR